MYVYKYGFCIFIYEKKRCAEWGSEWLLLYWVIFQLYHGENKLHYLHRIYTNKLEVKDITDTQKSALTLKSTMEED